MSVLKILILFLLSVTSAYSFEEGSVFQLRNSFNKELGQEVTFAMLQKAIFDNQCLICHDWVNDEQQVRSRITPGSPETSLIYVMVESGRMPRRGTPLTLEQLDLLRRYIMEL
jgi:hypothetical protein